MPVRGDTARQLDRLVAVEQVAARAPSLVAGVVRDGDLVWSALRGDVPDVAGQAPDVAATQYRIGSITKTMTTVLVLQLREAGRLTLEDRIGQHLTDTPFADRTVRELLAHAAGLPAEPTGSWWERSPGVEWTDLRERVGDGSGVLPRGLRYHYSNLAFGLLGRLVEELRGAAWRDALQQYLLDPLGMAQTSYLPGERAAQGYSVHPWSGRLIREPHQDTGAMAPAGQVWSTLGDVGRFAAFLVDPDPAVLSVSSVEEMTVPRSGTPDAGRTVTYGLGTRLILTPDGSSLVGHTGSMPGFLAGLFVDRERRTGAICLANVTTGMRCEGLPLDLLATLESTEPTLPAVWRPTGDLAPRIEEILGVWHWGATALEMCWEDGGLSLRQGSAGRAMRYRPVEQDCYIGVSGYHTGETLRVHRRADGSVHYLECATFVFTRSPYDPAVPIPGGLPEG
ncbi:MAG: serine hydrolase domain-containing protein [Nocardioidaceae bacterium]